MVCAVRGSLAGLLRHRRAVQDAMHAAMGQVSRLASCWVRYCMRPRTAAQGAGGLVAWRKCAGSRADPPAPYGTPSACHPAPRRPATHRSAPRWSPCSPCLLWRALPP